MDNIRIVPGEEHPYLKILILAGMGVSILMTLVLWIMFVFSGLNLLLHMVMVILIIGVVLTIYYMAQIHPEFIINTKEMTIRRPFGKRVVYDYKELEKEIFIIEKPKKYQVVFSTVLNVRIKINLSREHIKALEQMGFVLVNIGVNYQ